MKKLFFIFAGFILCLAACKKGGTPAETASYKDATEAEVPLTIITETKVIKGFNEESTPDKYDRVGYNRYYLKGQSNSRMPILIIVSGYVVDTTWFNRMARDLVARKNVEVWTINRRETLIENRVALDKDISDFIAQPDKRKRLIRKLNRTSNYLKGRDEYIRNWGFTVYMNDIKAVVNEAKKRSRSIFMGGWSDGVEYCMIYANYRFKSGFGSGDLRGLVFLDENPEWGKLSGREEELRKKIERQIKLMDEGHLYMKYYPSLAVHTLAMELASKAPGEASPLGEYFKLPEAVMKSGITNRGLIGWLYDKDVSNYSKGVRGGFAYLVRSGDLHVPKMQNEAGDDEKSVEKTDGPDKKIKKPGSKEIDNTESLSRWKSYKEVGEVTDIDLIISRYRSTGNLWEYFYPRKVLLDYFQMALCDFDCPDFNVFSNKENRLPVYYILTGTNNVGNSIPSGLKWYMSKSSIKVAQVVFNRLYDYAHGDIYFAADAPARIYQPLYMWLIKTSGLDKLDTKEENK
jgi:hypothetical protein